MARQLKGRLFPLALSPEATSVALGCRPSLISEYVKLGILDAYFVGTTNRRRIFVEDTVKFCKSHWRKVLHARGDSHGS
jgi:hypothetical protein